jgi:hypothetical protein
MVGGSDDASLRHRHDRVNFPKAAFHADLAGLDHFLVVDYESCGLLSDSLMSRGTECLKARQLPHTNGGSQFSPLSDWPRYPGGAIAGALVGAASVVLFFVGIPSLRSVLPVAVVLIIVLWAFRSRRSDG